MVCRNCGSRINEGDRFCSRCGIRVTEEAEEALNPSPEAGEEGEPGTLPEGLKGSTPESIIPLCIPEEKPERFRKRPKTCAGKGSGSARIRGAGKWGAKMLLGLFVMGVLILTANGTKLVNSWHRNFTTPGEYYRWVEQNAARKNAKIYAEYYVNYFMDYLQRYDRHSRGEIRVELGDAGRSMLEMADLEPWFDEGTFIFESTCKNSVMQSLLGLEFDGKELFQIETIMDLRDEAVYLGLPGLTETYLAVDTGEARFIDSFEYVWGMGPEEYLDHMEMLEVFYRECPDKRQVEALANKYLELLLNCIDDVKMRAGKTVRVGGISQSCTAIEVYLDEDAVQDILTVFLKELREDDEMEELLYQVCDLAEELGLEPETAYDLDFEDVYEAFQNRIDGILDSMDYYITYQNELDMTVYVNNKGEIIGRTMKFPNSREEITITCLSPHRGNRFGYKCSVLTNGEEIALTGSGKEFGNKISGSFTVKYEGFGIMDIEIRNLDIKSLKKGYLNGRFTIKAASELARMTDMDSSYIRLSDMELEMDVSMDRSSEKWSMELREGKEVWGSLIISCKQDGGRKIRVPSTRYAVFVEDEQDFEIWWNTIDWNALIRRLDQSGMSPEAVEIAEEFRVMDIREVTEELTHFLFRIIEYDK